MSLTHSMTYVLCVTGSRIINKRMAMLIEGVLSEGAAVRILSLPRGPWILDKSESPAVTSRLGRFTADLGCGAGTTMSCVLCFHWAVLPLAVLIGLFFKVPVVYDEHDHYELNTLEGTGSRSRRLLYSAAVRSIHRLFLPRVSLVTCIHLNHHVLKRHLERWQPAVLELHNYPASVWQACAHSRSPAGPLCFVYIGGVYVEKGVAAAADAFQLLPRDLQARAELHVFGDGDPALLEQLRTMNGVTVHNAVTPIDFRRFVAEHHCCGLALLAKTPRYSLVGTNCTKLFEYLALGLPVIATRVGEFPQIVATNHVGLLIDGEMHAGELSESMRTLISDEALFQQFSRNAVTLMSRPEMTWEHEWEKIHQTGIMGRKKTA